MPPWVIDYVMLHELAHLLEDRHTPVFWALLARYPRTDRARGYLEGYEAARGSGVSEAEGISGETGVG
jgi:predicted metal-dependent hydrolase